ncbi:MAG: hypothetical protein LOD90_02960 [Symbiobacteriaceae bacterium]
MRGRFWVGMLTGAALVAVFDRMGVRPGRWLGSLAGGIARKVEPLRNPGRRRRLVRETGKRARRWLAARIG